MAPYRGHDPDPVRQAHHARTQRAGARHDEVDAHAPLRGLVEGVDDLPVHEPVGLQGDTAGRTGRRLPADQVEEAAPEVSRADEELPEAGGAAVPGQVVEEVDQVGGQVGTGRQQGEALGAAEGMVQPGPHDAIAGHPGAAVADHQRERAVGAQPGQSVDHVGSGPFQSPGTGHAVALVEPGRQLQDRHDLRPPLRRPHQRPNGRAVGRRPVQRLFDGQEGGIGRGPIQEGHHRVGVGLVGIVDEHLAVFQGVEHVPGPGPRPEAGRGHRLPGRLLRAPGQGPGQG